MIRNSSDETSELMLLPQVTAEKIPSYKQIVQVSLYHFYIIGSIDGPEKYMDLIHSLKTVEDHDTIFIYINSYGGNLYTTIQIINAIKNCNGTVITCLEGEVISAATLIFLAGHKHIINESGSFMVHKYSHSVEGKGSDVASQVKFTERYFEELAYKTYADLMENWEIEQMLDGKDFWFSSREVYERLKARGREILGSESDILEGLGEAQELTSPAIGEEDTTQHITPTKGKSKETKTPRKKAKKETA